MFIQDYANIINEKRLSVGQSLFIDDINYFPAHPKNSFPNFAFGRDSYFSIVYLTFGVLEVSVPSVWKAFVFPLPGIPARQRMEAMVHSLVVSASRYKANGSERLPVLT